MREGRQPAALGAMSADMAERYTEMNRISRERASALRTLQSRVVKLEARCSSLVKQMAAAGVAEAGESGAVAALDRDVFGKVRSRRDLGFWSRHPISARSRLLISASSRRDLGR